MPLPEGVDSLGSGQRGKGYWGRWQLRGAPRLNKTEEAREGISGFGKKLNKVGEIGVEHSLWEMGRHEGVSAAWRGGSCSARVGHRTGANRWGGLRATRDLGLVGLETFLCRWVGLRKLSPAGLPPLDGAAMADGCRLTLAGVAV